MGNPHNHSEPVRLCFAKRDGTTEVHIMTRFSAELELEAMYHPGVARAWIEQIEAPPPVRVCAVHPPSARQLDVATMLCFMVQTGAGPFIH